MNNDTYNEIILPMMHHIQELEERLDDILIVMMRLNSKKYLLTIGMEEEE